MPVSRIVFLPQKKSSEFLFNCFKHSIRPAELIWNNDCLFRDFFFLRKKKPSEFLLNCFKHSIRPAELIWSNDCLFRKKTILKKKPSDYRESGFPNSFSPAELIEPNDCSFRECFFFNLRFSSKLFSRLLFDCLTD